MKFEKLLDEGKIEKVEKTDIDFNEIEQDVKTAKDNLGLRNYAWAMSIAYNSVFRGASNLMNFLGYRAIGKKHHKNTFEFLMEINFDQELVGYFDRVRKKRNNFIYRGEKEIEENETKEIIEKAEEFVQKIRTFVQKIRTGGEKYV